jgi:putative molybdopterin biosynthesis protein
MYNGEFDVVIVYLYDGETEQYNLPYVKREKVAGARVLLDEQLRINGISPDLIKGYKNELSSHISIASVVANGQVDAGVGIESVAKMVNVDFIPLIREHYD